MRLHAVLLGRRQLLAWTTGAAFPRWVYASAAAFWNVKAPSNWTDDEIRQLLTKSPWSKPITIKVVDSQVPPQRNRPVGIEPQQNGQVSPSSSRVEMGWPATISHEVKGTVRWEGARPVRDATKGALPSQFANHYTISVTGFNLGYSSLSSSFLEHIRAATSLTKKDRSVTQAALVHGAGSAVLLGFSKRSIQLSLEDSEVEFATTIGRMSIKTKFDFKEMMYHEALAI